MFNKNGNYNLNYIDLNFPAPEGEISNSKNDTSIINDIMDRIRSINF